MDLYSTSLWNADLDEVLETVPELSELAGKSVMITGCTGLVCSAVTDLLIRYNLRHDVRISIYAAARSRTKAEQRFRPFVGESWFSFVRYDSLTFSGDPRIRPDYVIHGAGNASPDKVLREPAETLTGTLTGTGSLLDMLKNAGSGRLVFISSSEVYGKTGGSGPISPGEYGYIDPLNVRNSYPEGKKAAEALCAAYMREYGVDSVIVRPGHVYGPTASPEDSRVSSAWAYDVSLGKDIIMKSDGAQIRSYCHCLDNASAVIRAMLRGGSCRAYNVSNPDSVLSIREMAELLASIAGVRIVSEIPGETEKSGFNPMNNSSLDASELLALGWKPVFSAERGFGHTVAIIKEALQKA